MRADRLGEELSRLIVTLAPIADAFRVTHFTRYTAMYSIKKKEVRLQSAERLAWLAIAKEVVAGKHRNETGSWKESILIGLECFKAEAEFKPALKILRKELEK